MARFIVQLKGGTSPSSVQPSIMATEGVTDVTATRQFDGFIVTGPASAKQAVAENPGVDAVYEDLQAVPQVADDRAAEDFLDTVKQKGGGEDTAPLVETEPTRSNNQ